MVLSKCKIRTPECQKKNEDAVFALRNFLKNRGQEELHYVFVRLENVCCR